jgi:UDP-N-acetylglucosamine--N-acetylmuramyl-(pentapeptide) pyrophosphoryl-undecaprenol N-acetylglucosamine transferase
VVINDAIAGMLEQWNGPKLAVVHLTGGAHIDEMMARDPERGVMWHRAGFEERMDLFYAVSDLVVARAGGAVAELTATASPSILVPGSFGSGAHQEGNARALERAGAARVVSQEELATLAATVTELLSNRADLVEMAKATAQLAKPTAALTIARTMIQAAA